MQYVIPEAKNINPITRDDIINAFCMKIVEKIMKQNKEGYRTTHFYGDCIYVDRVANKIHTHCPKGYKEETHSRYSFENYLEEVKQRFEERGYVIKRMAGYHDEYDIMW